MAIQAANYDPALKAGAELDTANIGVGEIATEDLADLAVSTAKVAADAVTNAKIADSAVSLENLDSGIAPAFVCVGGVLHTWDGGAATTDTAAITGVLATDIIVGNFTTTNTNGVMIEQIARTGADTVTITTSGNAADGDVIAIAVLRAAA